MSVVGFDVGSLRAVVAVARAGGVDVICNEVSERATPSLVSFDAKRRYLGEPAKTQQMSNFRNTVACLNRFVGRQYSEPAILESEKKFWTCQMGEKNGEVAAQVTYRDEPSCFSATEIMAMFLGKLKTIAQNEIKSAVSDCVISVPVYFTDAQRRAMLDAAQISGLNCLRLINDSTATSLCYGLTKNDMFSEKPKLVCFVDIGYSGMKVTITSFTKGNLEIKGTSWDENLGGRDFDEALADYFATQIQETYKQDIKGNTRAVLRLRIAAEKIKKVLSGITSTKAELETESRDFPLQMTRELFEQLSAPLLVKVESCLVNALKAANLTADQIDSVEIVGGTTRIPAVKQLISKVFGRDVSTTLNQDEAIARGCAFQCAIESPSFRVREFGVKDIISYPVKISWETAEGLKDVELFPAQSNLPCVKPLFTTQGLPVTIDAAYSNLCLVPAGVEPTLAKFTVTGAKGLSSSDSKVRVDVSINGHGLVCVRKALLIEEKIEEVPATAEGEEKQTKKVIHEYELSVSTEGTASRSPAALQQLKDSEYALALNDKYAQELDDSRNSLEEYIYEMRSKIEDSLKPYTLPADAASFSTVLNDAESWLYSDHEAENKEMYLAKLAELKKIGEPIAKRYREHQERPHAEALLRQLVQAIVDKVVAMDLEDADAAKIKSECANKLAWLDAEVAAQSALPLHVDPKLTIARINEQREKLLSVTSAMFAKAKPKPKPVPEEPASPSTDAESAPNMDVD